MLYFKYPVQTPVDPRLLWAQTFLEMRAVARGEAFCDAPVPGPEVIKLFSSSAQLSMKFQLLINVEIVKISGKFGFKTQKLIIYSAHKC